MSARTEPESSQSHPLRVVRQAVRDVACGRWHLSRPLSAKPVRCPPVRLPACPAVRLSATINAYQSRAARHDCRRQPGSSSRLTLPVTPTTPDGFACHACLSATVHSCPVAKPMLPDSASRPFLRVPPFPHSSRSVMCCIGSLAFTFLVRARWTDSFRPTGRPLRRCSRAGNRRDPARPNSSSAGLEACQDGWKEFLRGCARCLARRPAQKWHAPAQGRCLAGLASGTAHAP